MANPADWKYLRNVLLSLEKQVQHGEVIAQGPAWALPSDLTGDMARDYIEAAKRRFDEVEKAVKDAYESPIERVRMAGDRVGHLLKDGAKRALKIAKDIGAAAAEALDETVRRMEESGESIATGIGMGAVFVVVVGLLLLRELKGK